MHTFNCIQCYERPRKLKNDINELYSKTEEETELEFHIFYKSLKHIYNKTTLHRNRLIYLHLFILESFLFQFYGL